MAGIPSINEDTERTFTRKYNVNRPTVGISFRPGKKFGTFRLFIVGRPPSPHGKVQGDHTLAWGAISRCLEWLLEDVTLEEAILKIDQVHRSFNIAFLSSAHSCHELMERAVHMHAYITSGKCPKDLLCSWITEYLMTYTYIRNSLPEASVVLSGNSGTLGERTALAQLKSIEAELQKANLKQPASEFRPGSVKALSTLIDKRAIQATIQKSVQTNSDRTLQQILTFQLIGIHDLLQSLPSIRRVFFGTAKNNTLLAACQGQVPDELLSDLAHIILYTENQKIPDGEHRLNKTNIARAMSNIAILSEENTRGYGAGGYQLWH